MFGKCVLAAAAAVALSAGVASAQDQTTAASQPKGEVNQRLENQKDRIQAGVKDGQLTKGEAALARDNDRVVHAEERADRQKNGGNLTNKEKKQLNRQLNRNSRLIHRERHNNKTPK